MGNIGWHLAVCRSIVVGGVVGWDGEMLGRSRVALTIDAGGRTLAASKLASYTTETTHHLSRLGVRPSESSELTSARLPAPGKVTKR